MKIKLFTLVISLIISGSLVSQSIEDSLILHYSWDSTIFDQSGNGFDPLKFNATFTEDRFGNSKCALYFNGIDDYIMLPNNNDLQPQLPFSFSVWFKYDDLSSENSAIFTSDFTEDYHSGIWMNLNSANPSLRLSIGNATTYGPSGRKTFSTDQMIEANDWYFVVGIVEAIDNIQIYLNSIKQEGYYEGSATELKYSGNNGSIGKKDASYSNEPYFLKGYLDDFRYWKRIITQDEIDTLYYNLDDIIVIDTIVIDSIIYDTIIIDSIIYDTIFHDSTVYDTIYHGDFEQLFQVYPNPFTKKFFVASNISDPFSVELYDIEGRRITTSIEAKEFYLDIMPGMYFVKIKYGPGRYKVFKIIKQ